MNVVELRDGRLSNMFHRTIQFILVLAVLIQVAKCKKSSLAFVIDDTGSMGAVIKQVKDGAKAITDIIVTKKSSQIEDYVLVTFNDPDTLMNKTRDEHTLKSLLSTINAHGGGDCPEMSLTGILRAVEACLPGSYVYVFTDDLPKENNAQYLVNRIKNICQEKQIPVVFIFTPFKVCQRDRQDNKFKYDYYEEIAKSSTGQIYRLTHQNEVKELLKIIEETVKGDRVPGKTAKFPANQWSKFEFTIDDQTEYAVISTSGEDVTFELIQGPTLTYEKVTWIPNVKVVKVREPGNYVARVKSSSQTSVVVFARTDFTFKHGFSDSPNADIEKTPKQSTIGVPSHMLVSVADSSHSIRIDSVDVLDMDDKVIGSYPLTKHSEIYVTEKFLQPNETYKIAVKGVTSTGKPITRKSKTPITPLIKKIPPVISFNQKKTKTVNYNSDFTIECNVEAYPEPKIVWVRNSDKVVISDTVEAKSNVLFTNTLRFKNLKRNDTFVCKAKNEIGSSIKGLIITVKDPLQLVDVPKNITEAIYGNDVEIKCNIKSTWPMHISWAKIDLASNMRSNIQPSNKYSISPDGTILKINKVDLTDKASYICEPTLDEDPAIHKQFKTHVEVKGLEVPKLDKRVVSLNKMEHEPVNIPCQIVQGVPPPTMTCQFKSKHSNIYINKQCNDIHNIASVTSDNSGEYKCIATNTQGQDEVTINLNVNVSPVIKDFPAIIKQLKNSNVRLQCRILKGIPKPILSWYFTDEAGTQEKLLESKEDLELNNVSLDKTGTYTCIAENVAGRKIQTVRLEVQEKPKLKKNDVHITALEFELVDMPCKSIEGVPRPEMTCQFKSIDSSEYKNIPCEEMQHINRVTYAHTGEYKCIGRNSVGSEFYITTLTVYVRPEISKDIGSLTKYEKTDVELYCRIIKGIPNPKISWVFINNDGIETKQPNKSNPLHVSNVALEDAGRYKCIAENVAGSDEYTIELHVQAKPRIINEITDFNPIVNDTVLKVPCIAVGYPKPTIYWNLDPKIVNNDLIYVDKETLIIKDLSHTSDNKYLCEASNEFGTDKKLFRVTVTSEITFNASESTDIYILYGSTKQLNCSGNNPGDTYKWFIENVFNQTGPHYTIIDADGNDSGNYTCRVINNSGAKNDKTLQVYVGFEPEFEALRKNKQFKWDGDLTRLSCAIRSRTSPWPVFEWFKDGVLIKDSVSSGMDIDDWGNYTCRVSNVHGSIQRDFEIITPDLCLINRGADSLKIPLILENNTTLSVFTSKRQYLEIKKGKELILSCPRAFENIPETNYVSAICEHEDKFSINGKIYKMGELSCNEEFTPEIKKTNVKCNGEETEMIKIGLSGNTSVSVFEVCINTRDNEVVYTKYGMRNPYYNFEGDITPNPQKHIYGSQRKALPTCQLVNAQDVTYGPAQVATLTPYNEILCLKSKQNMTWNDVEENVRKILTDHSEIPALTVWSGASKKSEIGGITAPKYLWKVIKNTAYDEEIALVYNNSPEDIAPLCKIVKPEHFDISWIDYPAYPSYVCQLSELSEKIGIPTEVFV